ncbi:MAG: ACT domain-containing protein [Acetanaerobacterium sp.]
MKLNILPQTFVMCKLKDLSAVNIDDPFLVFAKTDKELSLICLADRAPKNCLKIESGFRAFRVCGAMDFALVGILAELSAVLAREKISIVAFSTFDTDYILVREALLERTVAALTAAGHEFM